MLKSLLKFTFVFLLFMPILTLARSANECTNGVLLTNGFNLENYTNCQALIKQCPPDGLMPNESCVRKVVEKNISCRQLNALVNVIDATPVTISAEQAGKIILVTQYFMADGQESYYLISSQACLITTNIDPRDLSASLKKRYKDTAFMAINYGKPTSQIHSDKSQSFIATLKVTKTCLACDIIGWAKIKFDFMENGHLEEINLESFNVKAQP